MASPDPAPRAQFDEVLASLTQVDLLKSRQEVLASEADIARRKADVAARVREVYARQGVTVSEELITQGVNQYFEGRLKFEKPRMGLSILTAWAWLYRLPLLGLAGFTAGLVILANVLVYYTVIVPEREAAAAKVKAVQSDYAVASQRVPGAITGARSVIKQLESKLEAATQLGLPAIIDAAAVAQNQLGALAEKLAKAEELNAGAQSTNIATEDLNRIIERNARFKEAQELVTAVTAGVPQITQHYDAILSADRNLEAIWKQFQELKAPAGPALRVDRLRNSALEEIGHLGDPAKVKSLTAQIETALAEFRQLAFLPEQIRGAAEQARLIAVEPQVTTTIEQVSKLALNAVEHSELAAARRGLSQLQELVQQLEQSYTLRIVNRGNEYSRIWYNNPDRTGKLYYVIVEAVGPGGEILPMDIVSEQDGSTRRVNCWAERVDEATYEAVGTDKKNDGIIQQDVFARKQRGYRSPHYLMGNKKDGDDLGKGRLNRWPRK